MSASPRSRLPGEETLLASWGALAAGSPGAYMMHSRTSSAAVFPQWIPLNNAILLGPRSPSGASEVVAELNRVYAGEGVPSWALWLPRLDDELVAPGTVAVDGMTWDTANVVMTRELADGMPSHPEVRRTTVLAASVAGDDPVAIDVLPSPEAGSDVDGWVLVRDGYAVAGAWTFLYGIDVGVYAVGTAPGWRRHGIARALMLHVLADAYRRGARTASLQSTPMAESLYAGLGFRPVGSYDEWVPLFTR